MNLRPYWYELLWLIDEAIEIGNVPKDVDLLTELADLKRHHGGKVKLTPRVRAFGMRLWRERQPDPYAALPAYC